MEPLVGPSTFQSRHLVRWRRCDQITNDYQTHRRDAAVGNGGIDGFGRGTACACGVGNGGIDGFGRYGLCQRSFLSSA